MDDMQDIHNRRMERSREWHRQKMEIIRELPQAERERIFTRELREAAGHDRFESDGAKVIAWLWRHLSLYITIVLAILTVLEILGARARGLLG